MFFQYSSLIGSLIGIRATRSATASFPWMMTHWMAHFAIMGHARA